ncbi:HlyC/CorC family transporter [Paenibacillus sp. CAU 1523]|uniref:HlyC/CorC family transporter n=1 Tax=Paenibacillus arenosi TaxID=2774142 RepID=A0ABR9AZW7_9BACL|nr:HlyC/CorC family transporter [Paenibacillus arenosi]
MFTEILILLILIVLNAFFAASEIALISLNDNKVKSMAEAGHKKAKLLHSLLSEPSRFLATIQIGITLAGFMASAFAAESFAGRLAQYLYEAGVPIPRTILETVSVIVITIILSYFTLVFGELVPKRLAMKKYESIAMFAAVPLTVLSKVTAPFVRLLTGSMNLIVRILGVNPDENKEQVTEEEIRMMVDVGNENGTIQEDEKMMINNIFELDNKTVTDIMTHRSSVIAISMDSSLKEVAKLINIEKYTRYPIYEGDIDNIVGILHVKDIIKYLETDVDDSFNLKDLIRVPYFIPASKRIDDLFKELQNNKVHIAVAIDEYGGTAGIVTVEDLLEEIVGNIFDEHDDEEEEKEIEQVEEGVWVVDGTIQLRVLNPIVDADFPTDDYDTLSGFVIGQLGRIPEQSEKPVVMFGGFVFEVLEVDEKRIHKLKVLRSNAEVSSVAEPILET